LDKKSREVEVKRLEGVVNFKDGTTVYSNT